MVKNNTGGNKHKKKKKVTEVIHDRELTLKTDGQEYGQVTKLLGNCRFDVDCLDGKSRLCHVRGVLRKKKVFVKLGDLVIASLRDFEDGKADITVEDGDCKVIKTKHIAMTDCPDGLYKFFLTNDVLMLTSEY